MSHAAEFYNTLLAVDFAVVGLLIAGVFVSLQIIHQDRLYRLFRTAPRRRLVAAVILSLISLCATAAGAFLSSFPGWRPAFFHAALPSGVVARPWFALSALAAFLVCSLLTLWAAVSEIFSLQPAGLVREASRRMTGAGIRRYLVREYGIPEPFSVRVAFGPVAEGCEGSSHEEEDRGELVERQAAFRESLLKDASGAGDPLEPITAAAIRAIRDRDVPLLGEALDAFAGVFEKGGAIRVQGPASREWDANSTLSGHLATYVLGRVSLLALECRREGSPELLQSIYSLSARLVSSSMYQRDASQVAKVVSFFKLEADRLPEGFRSAYESAVGTLRRTCERAFPEQNNSFGNAVVEESFRALGWLAERLMSAEGIEERPAMYDQDFKTRYEILFNGLMSFSWLYESRGARFYPLIFFDAVDSLLDGLVGEALKEGAGAKDRSVHEGLFDCANAFARFAESAIAAGNGKGASLAAMRLTQAYGRMSAEPDVQVLRTSGEDVIGLMVRLAFAAAGKRSDGTRCEFLPEGVEGHMFRALAGLPPSCGRILDREVFEGYVRAGADCDREAVVLFLRRLGAERGSAFGLRL